jgi:hypothetical protein
MASVESLSVAVLAQHCQEQTARFSRREPTDDSYCFELLRRALGQGLDDAFSQVFGIFQALVLAWVQHDTRFARTGESPEYFVNHALSNFYFALRGPKFERFPTLQNALAYLKMTTHSVVTQYLRDLAQPPSMRDDAAAEVGQPDPALEQRLGALSLWERICALLPDPRSQHLAHCVFVQEMRPREIVRAFPGQWRSERDVTVALYRIRVLLRADPVLRAWS